MIDKEKIIKDFIPEAIDIYKLDENNLDLDKLVKYTWFRILFSDYDRDLKHEDVERVILGDEEVERRRKEREKRRLSEELYKICHEDGSEWTGEEVEQWVLDNANDKLIYCDLEGFYVDEFGELVLADECGSFIYVSPPEFNIHWHVPALLNLLSKIEDEKYKEFTDKFIEEHKEVLEALADS